MNKRINRLLGKIFILGTAFMWISCDSTSTSASEPNKSPDSNDPKDFINIEEELSKMKRPDTTGLRGTCTTEYDACMRSILSNRYSEYVSYIGRVGHLEASSIAKEKINEFLESPNGASLSESIRNCYKGATQLISLAALDYGVIPCNSSIEIGKEDSCEVPVGY